jgi:transposase
MERTYRPYEVNQRLLLPPDLREWLPEGHLALFILDVVNELDLSEIYRVYELGDGRGQPPYHPAMMVALLLYGYCTGKPSSRQIERASHESVPFRVLAGDQHPDHDTIAEFRRQHLGALARLFVQVLELCRAAGLVKLGHVALDGTKVKANASKHKAMSYERMCAAEKQLEEEVARLLAHAEAVDEAEDEQFGKGRRGDELPAELVRRESRLRKIREAKTALEAEARERAERAAAEARQKLAAREQREAETGRKLGGKPPHVPDPDTAKPEPKTQRNFTDPESRIMKDGASKAFEQAYNAQAAVDGEAQVIVAAAVTQQTNDSQQLMPMLEKVRENCGELPRQATADAGYFNTEQLTDQNLSTVDLYVAPDRQKHGEQSCVALAPGAVEGKPSLVEQMRQKLRSPEGHAVYKLRKAIVEPVFGTTKEARGFRRFSFRGLSKVTAEWDLICLTHNLLKLWRARTCLAAA